MARYNTSLATNSISGTATISSPYSGAFTAFTGTAPYSVTLPSPVLYPGSNQTFYNATTGTVTLITPAGNFVGTGGSGSTSVPVYAGNVVSITSDGTNYVVISEDGSALIATSGNFSGNVDVTGILSVGAGGGVSIAPSTTGNINNVNIGSSVRASGAFSSLTANGAVTLTANTGSSSTSTGTLVITGGLGVSGTINAASVNASLTGTIQTAAQPNITSIGTLSGLSVTGTGTFGVASATQIRTEYYAERSFSLGYFPNTTANQACDIRFGNNYINGNIEIEVTSTYSYQNATGILRKSISVGANQGTVGGASGFWWNPSSRIVEANGPVVDNFYIGDIEWDATNGTYRITIYHTVSSGNACTVRIKAFGSTAVDNINALTTSAFYTRTAPSPSRQYVNFNENVAIGNSNPQARLHVSAGSAGLAPRGGGFTKFMFDNNTASDVYLEIANNSTNSAGVLFSKSTGSYGLVNYNLSTDSLLLYSNSNARLVINSDGMVSINAGATPSFSGLGARTAPKFWVQSGPAVMSNQTNGSTYPDYSATALMTGPATTRSAMNTYFGGIGFDHLLNYTSQGNMTYNNDPMVWVGAKMYDTPGYERSSFVVATREVTDGTGRTIERMNIDPFGRMTIPYQTSFSAYKNGSNFASAAGAFPVTGWVAIHNTGSALNATTGRFTAPVTGTYFFILSFMVTSQSTPDTQSRWYKNGSYVVGSNHVFSATYNQVTVPLIIKLTAGDYVEPYLYSNTTGPYLYNDRYTHIHGHLLG